MTVALDAAITGYVMVAWELWKCLFPFCRPFLCRGVGRNESQDMLFTSQLTPVPKLYHFV